jgi:cysteine desulfurase
MKEMRDRLYDTLKDRIKDVNMNGHPEMRLPNTLS